MIEGLLRWLRRQGRLWRFRKCGGADPAVRGAPTVASAGRWVAKGIP